MRLFILGVLSFCSSLSASTREETMSTIQTLEENKEIVRRIYEDCLNRGAMELLPQLVSGDYIGVRGERGPSAFANNVAALRRGFPNIRFTIEDLIAEGDRVAVRWTWQGTHTGIFNGVSPTQKEVSNEGIVIYQLRGDKIVRTWIQTDRLGVLQEIGVVAKQLIPGPPVKDQE
jgi:predicted ester cyclase